MANARSLLASSYGWVLRLNEERSLFRGNSEGLAPHLRITSQGRKRYAPDYGTASLCGEPDKWVEPLTNRVGATGLQDKVLSTCAAVGKLEVLPTLGTLKLILGETNLKLAVLWGIKGRHAKRFSGGVRECENASNSF